MYVDESGDSGITNSPTRYFLLSAIIIHELRWRVLLDELIEFRQHLRLTKGLKLREEIHATHFINNPGSLVRIKRNDRLDIMKQCIDWTSTRKELSVITVSVDKQYKQEDVFNLGWERLIQRFENTIKYHNFPGISNPDERGLLLPDNTDGLKLRTLLRKMRRFNPVPHNQAIFNSGSRNLTLDYVIEDPFMKDSATSYFHQIVDVIAYCARQMYEPNAYMKKKEPRSFIVAWVRHLTKKQAQNIHSELLRYKKDKKQGAASRPGGILL